ncbi:putative drug exporter of the RND superfamily [Micrococcales bacterium KH10]|nr:putative drug exporter of the RND superfamily [Micrococcales bacterium KH10]
MTTRQDRLGKPGSRSSRTGDPRVPAWLRVTLAIVVIVIWFAGAAIGGPYFGKVSEVSSNDQTTYLPESAEATQVQHLLGTFNTSDAIPVVVVFTSEARLTEAHIDAMNAAVATLTSIDGVGSDMSPLLASDDGMAAQAFLTIDSGASVGDAVQAISKALKAQAPAGTTAFVTGPAAFIADLTQAFSGIDGILLMVALVAVFVILIVVYRSLLLPIAVLMTSVFALTVALLTVWWLAKAGVVLLSGQTQGILFILVIGAATDYSLLYVARYREELRRNEARWAATRRALRRSVEPILASGGTVIAGLMCLLLSDLKSNSTLGPVASIGIVFAMLAALSLLPAVLFVFGRSAFWPKRPRFDPTATDDSPVPTTGLWARIAHFIVRRPRNIWLATTLLLIAGAAGVTQLDAQGVPQSDLVLTSSGARDGQEALGKHFPAGGGSPAYVIADEDHLQQVADLLVTHAGVDNVTVLIEGMDYVTAPMTPDGIVGYGPPGAAPPEPRVVDGQVLLQATLADAADSEQAQSTIRQLRDDIAESSTHALIGGVTATAIDTNDASIHDRNLIIPVVLAMILLILMVLLRSVLAPVLLVVSTVVSFGTALGVAAIMFNHVFDFPGADPAVPLYGFVFLVALGIDYNIFLMTRVREETLVHGTRRGILRGLSVTGGVITSAGLVLAATFAALSVIPILFLVQIAFIVAFGVLLDTFLVRALLIPALVYDIGPKVWWPSKLSHRKDES